MILAFVKGGWLRSITFTALLTTHLVSCEVPQPVSTTLSAPILTPKVIVSSPSDPTISTQCLASDLSGVIWFTSGSVGTSYLIKRSSIVKENGEIFKWERWPLEGYFAEGCVSLGQQILILTDRKSVV